MRFVLCESEVASEGQVSPIPHAELLKSVARRIVDRRVLHLIKMWYEPDRRISRIRLSDKTSRSALSNLLHEVKGGCHPKYSPVAKRVLMFLPTFSRGGAERRAANTAKGLAERGYRVKLISSLPLLCSEESFERELLELGLDYCVAGPTLSQNTEPTADATTAAVVAGLPIWWATECAKLVADAVLAFRPTVVHGWVDRWATVSGIVSGLLGVPRVVVGQTSMTPAQRGYPDAEILRECYQALACNPRVVLVNASQQCASAHERWLGLPTGSIRTIRTSVMPGTLPKPSPEAICAFRQHLGLSQGDLVVGTAMRLEQPKDPLLWLDVAHEIAIQRKDVQFVIAGAGTYWDHVKRRVSELGLSKRITLLGAITNIELLYSILDVFLLTSVMEAIPNVIVEAQSFGCPVVATNVGGVQEGVAPGKTGLLVDDRSPTTLAGVVLSALADQNWRLHAALAGPAFIASRFGYSQMITAVEKIYL